MSSTCTSRRRLRTQKAFRSSVGMFALYSRHKASNVVTYLDGSSQRHAGAVHILSRSQGLLPATGMQQRKLVSRRSGLVTERNCTARQAGLVKAFTSAVSGQTLDCSAAGGSCTAHCVIMHSARKNSDVAGLLRPHQQKVAGTLANSTLNVCE